MGNRYYRSVEKPKTHYERQRAYKRANPDKVKCGQLRAKYGITLQQWREMFEAQNSKCLICKTTEPSGRGWHTDHDHKTGEVRGILCNHCNVGLGSFKDNPELLIEASNYLRR